MYSVPLNYTLKIVKTVNFMSCVPYHDQNKSMKTITMIIVRARCDVGPGTHSPVGVSKGATVQQGSSLFRSEETWLSERTWALAGWWGGRPGAQGPWGWVHHRDAKWNGDAGAQRPATTAPQQNASDTPSLQYGGAAQEDEETQDGWMVTRQVRWKNGGSWEP